MLQMLLHQDDVRAVRLARQLCYPFLTHDRAYFVRLFLKRAGVTLFHIYIYKFMQSNFFKASAASRDGKG